MEVVNVKKERKANFSDEEVRCLLQAIAVDRDVILCKLGSSLTAKNKKEAWKRVLKAVNGCGVCLRMEDEVRKKFKDLKSAALKAQADGMKTGGGAPKEVPYKDIIFTIIGDRSDVAAGIDGNNNSASRSSTHLADTNWANPFSMQCEITNHSPTSE